MRTLLVSLVMGLILAAGSAWGQDPFSVLPPPTELPPEGLPGLPPELVPPPTGVVPPFTEPIGLPSEPFVASAFPPAVLWVNVSYLHWWSRNDAIAPLITLGSADDALPGALGQADTRLLVAGTRQIGHGFRLGAGYMLEPIASSVEGNFLFLSRDRRSIAVPPDNTLVVARPFIDAQTGAESAFVVFSPGIVDGFVSAAATTNLFGFEGNYRYRWEHQPGIFWSVLGGFRHLHLSDRVRIEEYSRVIVQEPFQTRADEIFRVDDISSRNIFLGPQGGLELECYWDYLIFSMYGKLAVGMSYEHARLRGETLASNFAASPFAPVGVGFLVQETNAGTFNRAEVGLVGEIGVNFGMLLTDNLKLSVGYSYLHWTNVARAGNQISRTINPTQDATTGIPGQLIGPRQPAFAFRDSAFWTQGFNFMLEVRY